MKVVLSYGLGVDSTSILLRWLEEPETRNFDLADLIVLTAQTGDEYAETGRDVEAHIRLSPLFEFLPVAMPLAERAATIAAEHQVRGADALYFAVAETLGDRLVTLNPRQLQRGNSVVETVRPRV